MKSRSIILTAFLAGTLAACGSADFRSSASGGAQRGGKGSSGKASADAEKQNGKNGSEGGDDSGTTLVEAKALEWNLACEGPVSSSSKVVDTIIDGGGDFEVASGSSYKLKFTGKHCEGVTPRKDILFLFDGSSSMSRNDPLVNGSCGRLDTMQAIMASFSGGTGNRFGLVSFSSGNQSSVTSSGRFYDTDSGLISALEASKNGAPISQVICDSNRIGTNYDTGFAAAESLIKLGAAKDAGTIVFFVSDGKPLFGQTGEAVAARLRSSGVLIATVMVKGEEDVMRDLIASRDAKGVALHMKVADISQLTNAISQLASRAIVPDVLRYRPVNTSTWTAINVYPTALTKDWSLQEFTFDQNSFPDGIEVEYLYFLSDTTGKGSLSGTLTFTP